MRFQRDRHLELLTYLSPHPLPVSDLCADMNCGPEALRKIANAIKDIGIKLECKRKTIAIARKSWPRATALVEAWDRDNDRPPLRRGGHGLPPAGPP